MSMEAEPEVRSGEELMRLGADIVAAYVSRNPVSADAVPEIIFDTPVAERYDRAVSLLGFDPRMLSQEAGHA